MTTDQCGCVYATAENTESVRKGFEVGGYIKEFCALHKRQPDPPPSKELVERLEHEIANPDTSGAPYVNDTDLLKECLAEIKHRSAAQIQAPASKNDLPVRLRRHHPLGYTPRLALQEDCEEAADEIERLSMWEREHRIEHARVERLTGDLLEAQKRSRLQVETSVVKVTVAAADYLQRYFFEVHGLKYSLEDARIVLHTAMCQPEKTSGIIPMRVTIDPRVSADTVEFLRSDSKLLGKITGLAVDICADCPPVGYPTDETRCAPCPRRARKGHGEKHGV